MDRVRITADEIRAIAAAYTAKRERVEALIREVVTFDNPLEATWLAQRIVDALKESGKMGDGISVSNTSSVTPEVVLCACEHRLAENCHEDDCCDHTPGYSRELIEAGGQLWDLWKGVGGVTACAPHRYPAGSEAIWMFVTRDNPAYPEEWMGFPVVIHKEA